jgi:hypothetical protein
VNEGPTSAEPIQASPVSRFQGLAVFAAVALPMLAAYIVFYTGVAMPTDTVNEGELLQPARSLQQLPLAEADGGAAIDLLAEAPKWRYLILGGNDCASECDKLLYTSRQVHIRLGDKADRVERLLLTTSPLSAERRTQLHAQHPRLRFVQVNAGELNHLIDGPLTQTSALLVDPQGFAMMVYNNSHSGNQLLKDIKRLLKYSYKK